MSKYTTEVRFICETAAGYTESQGLSKVEEIITAARPSVFDFDYTLFDAEYKSVLETKILRHFYTREIGFETIGLWKLKLRTKLIEILPYYNQLYNSELIEFNPLYDVDLTTDHLRNGSGESAGSTSDSSSRSDSRTTTGTTHDASTDTGLHWNMYSDTPQGAVTDLDDGEYLTNAAKDTDNQSHTGNSSTSGSETFTSGQGASGTSTGTYSDTEDYLEHVIGKTGGASYSSRLQEFRDTFLNIDMMIINELEPLFMHLW